MWYYKLRKIIAILGRAPFLIINIQVKINKKVTIFAIAKARYDLIFKIFKKIGRLYFGYKPAFDKGIKSGTGKDFCR